MKRKKALEELIEKVGAGGPILHPLPEWWSTKDWVNCVEAFHGSLDAAKALHEAVLPGWGWDISCMEVARVWDLKYKGYAIQASAKCPARAWLLAILHALRAMEH